NGVKKDVINEMRKLTPEKANEAKIEFDTLKPKEGKGKVLLNLSKNLIARSNNLSETQIDDLNKEIFKNKSNLLEKENVTWLLEPKGFENKKSNQNEQGDDEQESCPQQHINNQHGEKKKKSKKKKKKEKEEDSDDSDEYTIDMKPAKRKRNE
ncbi:MAG: hypothetical protein EZS28_036511, partial [Streblomastix strix]